MDINATHTPKGTVRIRIDAIRYRTFVELAHETWDGGTPALEDLFHELIGLSAAVTAGNTERADMHIEAIEKSNALSPSQADLKLADAIQLHAQLGEAIKQAQKANQ
jgi:hypothetical protein